MSSTKRQMSFRLGMKRNYGKHEVYFELGEVVEVGSGHERQAAFDNLLVQLKDQIRHYEEIELPFTKLPHDDGSAASAVSHNGTDSFILEKIVVESYQGKRRVKAVGGNYSKWGVPCYEGVVTDLDLDSLAYGEHHQFAKLKLTVIAEMENGKPKRVRSIK